MRRIQTWRGKVVRAPFVDEDLILASWNAWQWRWDWILAFLVGQEVDRFDDQHRRSGNGQRKAAQEVVIKAIDFVRPGEIRLEGIGQTHVANGLHRIGCEILAGDEVIVALIHNMTAVERVALD